MHCSGCGKDIPFAGQVCPHCQRDKGADQLSTVIAMIAMLCGGFIGNLIAGFGGMVMGGLGFGFVAVIATMGKTTKAARKPPRVRVEASNTISPAVPPTMSDDPTERLARLDRLKAAGTITEQEHRQQRDAVISSL